MKTLALGCCIVVLLSHCKKQYPPHTIPLEALSSKETGIDFSNNLIYKSDVNILEYLYYYNGGGVAIGDINNDGLEDIYFTANQSSDKLYLNQGNLQFKDITKEAGIYTDDSWSSGVSMEDVNNDGFLDIFVAKVGRHNSLQAHNLMYLNNGDGTFAEKTKELGLNFSGLSTQGAFLDYDRDGDLDLYLLNHAVHTVHSYGTTEKRTEEAPLSGDRFYENRINEVEGTFVDVTKHVGIYASPLGYGLAIRVADLNNDGWQDIYVGNDFHENDFIYLNNGDKTFTESVDKLLNHSSRFTMGVDVEDLNQDGKLDIFTTDMMPNKAAIFLKSGGEDTDKVDRIKKDFGFSPQLARNNLQLQNDDGYFSEVSLMTSTYATDWSWSVLLADFDNDARKDIFITNGIVKRPNDLDYINYISGIKFSSYALNEQDKVRKEIIAEMPTLKIPNVLFKNFGELRFSELSDSFLGVPSFSNGAAYADLDNDGDLDLAVNNINAPATLYRNNLNKGGVTVSLSSSGKAAKKGAKLTLFSNGDKMEQRLHTTKGFQSSSSHHLHFGLPAEAAIDSFIVEWPNGRVQHLKNVARLPFIEIKETEENHKRELQLREKPSSLFSITVLPSPYEENGYLDYERERLIPEKLSSEGRALLVEDFNQDGIDDLFLGGARYQPSEVWMGTKRGAYEKVDVGDFLSDRNFEDTDVASIDIDLDGDRDLYVVSGGNDLEQGHRYMMDRIYLNDGKGDFTRGKVSLPSTNGSTVAVGDFDQDGVEDIFVGSRSIPGAYGLSPDSYVMRNNAGKGLEAVLTHPLGMVTDAKWKDIDEDGWIDLILVGDWMPITVLKNQGDGTFENVSKELGLGTTFGLWNTLDFYDFDGNGRLDIIAGNTGQNSKWQATPEKPIQLYLDDFDENGQLDPMIFYDFFGTYVPFASKDKLAEQLPSIKKKFQKYEDFSKISTVKQLTSKKQEDYLQTKYVNELRSMIYLQKEGSFQGIPLPFEAQQSTIEDICVDTNTGAVSYVGNFMDNVIELGPQDANPGGQLLGFNAKNNTFEKTIRFGLPKEIAARKIQRANNGSYVVATQNNFVFFIK